MSTRIIIEKDGERYVVNDLEARLLDNGRFFGVDKKTDKYYYLGSTFTQLPPVIRTDNSEVIANLEAENEKLKAELEDKYSEILKVIAARNELAELNRECCDENEKLHEALKELLVVAQNRLPTMPTVDELEIIGKAQDVINGISKKADDISKKGEDK